MAIKSVEEAISYAMCIGEGSTFPSRMREEFKKLISYKIMSNLKYSTELEPAEFKVLVKFYKELFPGETLDVCVDTSSTASALFSRGDD